MPKIGITGWKGHVGQELLKYPDTIPLMGDVRNKDEIEMAVRKMNVNLIVHLASISDVDQCENPSNKALVSNVNLRGTYYVAEVAEKFGCGMVMMSSAHVFDGLWGNYKETSRPFPKNYYGRSKESAEALRHSFPDLKIVRTSYLFDYERLAGEIYALRKGHSCEYPNFIQRSFMYLPHYVESLYAYLLRFDEMPNMLHISGTQSVSWYQFMVDLAVEFGMKTSLVISRKKELAVTGCAPRPYKAGLNVRLSQKLKLPQYDYIDGLRAMIGLK